MFRRVDGPIAKVFRHDYDYHVTFQHEFQGRLRALLDGFCVSINFLSPSCLSPSYVS